MTYPTSSQLKLWSPGWREEALARLAEPWDVIVIGGGITGAGILACGIRGGLKVLLVEQSDFASGTSCRSSKLVHGGLRYLKHLQVRVTLESVRERQQLLRTAPGLVKPLPFFLPMYRGDSSPPWLVSLGLKAYTKLAPGTGGYRRVGPDEVRRWNPRLRSERLLGGFYYGDAQTDDARLVLRVLRDALVESEGRGLAINYLQVVGLLTEGDSIGGVVVRDVESGAAHEIRARSVISATGVWADSLRGKVSEPPRLRPLRGSHLFFSAERLPVDGAVAFTHPSDGRPVFVYAWEGVTLVGTTDVDHRAGLGEQPLISSGEAEYLLDAVRFIFPGSGIGRSDVLSTQSGVRPVVDTGNPDPSAESRDHALWFERGLLTVTGGKMTTFRPVALSALARANRRLDLGWKSHDLPAVTTAIHAEAPCATDEATWRRLCGRYGLSARDVLLTAGRDLSRVDGTEYLWAELLWSIHNEAVTHLSDLLLRRFRVGILLRDGAESVADSLKPALHDYLGWEDARWEMEKIAFLQELTQSHGNPTDWAAAAPAK